MIGQQKPGFGGWFVRNSSFFMSFFGVGNKSSSNFGVFLSTFFVPAGSCRLPKELIKNGWGWRILNSEKMTHFELERMGKMEDGNFCPKKKHRKEEFGM